MKVAVTYGFDRQRKVPDVEGTTPKVCTRCNQWFASQPKERICNGCLRPSERARRANSQALAGYARAAGSLSKRPAQRRTKPAASGRDLCMELALELAERIDYPKGRPVQMARSTKLAYTRRNVALGLQDPRDLERYAA